MKRLYSAMLALVLLNAPLAFSEIQSVSNLTSELLSSGSNEPASLLDDYAVTRWQAEDGLPEDSVFSLVFSEDG